MFSEIKVRDHTKIGNSVYYWKKIRSDIRNEYFDIECYCLGAALMFPGIQLKESNALPKADDEEKDKEEN
jgi:hypothetical protein